MKFLLLLLTYFTCQTSCMAQTIENPAFDRCDIPAFHITKVEITKDTTYIFCSYYAEKGSWASISKDTYLRDFKNQKTFPLLRCEGLPFSPETRSFLQNESCELLLCFPSIVGTEVFDFIESEDERAFNIYNVSLKRSYKTSYSDMDLKNISEMVLAYESSNDLEKANLYKDIATSLNNLVSYNVSKGNYPEAIRLGTVEMRIREKVFGKEELGYIKLLGNIAEYYAALGNYEEAIQLGTEVAKTIKQAFGPEDPNYVNLLDNLISFNRETGNNLEALRLQIEISNIKKKSLGAEHVEYAHSLANIAVFYSDLDKYDEAIKFGTEAIEIYKRVSDTKASDYVISLSNLANYNYQVGNYSEAIRLEKEAADILREVNGAEYNYALSLNKLTNYYIQFGKYYEALQVATEDVEIFKRIIGTNCPEYASSLLNVARINSRLGNLTLAVRFGTEAKEIYKSVLGPEHPSYAASLSNLAGYYQDFGYYDDAFKLMTEAIEIEKLVYGSEHINYAISLNNLATLYLEVGNYSEAIRLGTEAMEIYKKVLGTKHPEYAISLNNLANYYTNVGDYYEAIRLVTEAIEIYKNVLGINHPNYATSLNILAINYSEIDNFSEAIKIGTEVTELYKKVLGTEHPDYARSLNSLASYYAKTGNYTEAIRLVTEAMEVRKRILGAEHPLYATSLLNDAAYNSFLRNYNEAIRLGSEAREVFKRIFGTEHPLYAMSLSNLADYYQYLNEYERAFNCLQQSLNISQSFILHNFSELSSRNQEAIWTKKYLNAFNNFLPSIVNNYKTKESISELFDKTCLFAKGILLNTNIERRKLILESGDSGIIDTYNALVSNIIIYNKLLETPIKERVIDTDSLKIAIERQEMMLAKESKVFGDYSKNLNISWKDVQRRLGNNDIAIEFLDFSIDKTDSTMYVALTIKKEYDSPHMVTLFEEKQLKAVPEEAYYTRTDISNLVWNPLEEELKGTRNIYFAPSGELNRIGIEYIPISITENISDVYTLHRLSSTRQLAMIQDKPDGKNTILYGGINYNDKPSSFAPDSTSVDGTVLKSAFSRANVDSFSLRSSFDYLEGTRRETGNYSAPLGMR